MTIPKSYEQLLQENLELGAQLNEMTQKLEILQHTEAQYRSLISSTSEGLVLHGADGAIVYTNVAAERILGLTSDQMKGITPLDVNWRVIHEDGSDFPGETHPAMITLLTGKAVSNVVMGVGGYKLDDTISWILVNSQPIFDNDEKTVRGVVASFTDINALKQIEALLKKNKERYRIISELISDYAYSFRIDPDNQIIGEWTTDSFERMTGYTPQEVTQAGNIIYVPEDRERVRADVMATLQGQTVIGEYRIRTKEGKERWLQISRYPVWDEQEKRVIRFYGAAKDITEQKKAESALIDSENRLRAIFENSMDAIILATVDGDVLNCNAATERMFGYTKEQIMAENGARLVDLSDPRLAPATEERINTSKFFGELTFLRSNGKKFQGEVASNIFTDAHENKFMTLILRDVDDRKHAEEALRQSEERYRITSELISDYAYSFRVEPDRSIVREWITDSYVRMTGYEPGEVMRKGMYSLYAPQDQERAHTDMEMVLQGKRTQAEYQIITKSGEKRWVYLSRYPVWDEQEQRVVRFYGAAQDITERKEAEKALKESEKRYRLIAELISDYAYIFRVEPDQTLVREWITDSYVRMTGYEADEIINLGLYMLYAPEDRERTRNDIEMVLQGKTTHSEYQIITKSGEKRWIYVSRYPVWDEQEQRVVRFYGAAQDITERKEAQQRGIDLAIDKQRIKVLADFVRDTSHDLRTPMASIMMGIYIVQRMQDDEQRKKKFKEIERNIFYLDKLLTQFQKMAVLDSYTELPLQIGNIYAVIQSALYSVTKQINEKQVSITTDFASEDLLIRLDEDSLETALIEILQNAIYFTPDGGHIDIRCILHKSAFLSLEIVDNGIGIPADSLPHIFERFFKVSEARNTGGAGLGLTIAKRTIELHHGSIEVESIVGQGTTFRILLPAIL